MKREFTSFAEWPVPFPSDRWRVKVLDNHDGDTVTARMDRGFFDDSLRDFRFTSIDAYELNERDPALRALALQGRDYVRSVAVGRYAYAVTRMDPEKYGRVLADFSVLQPDGTMLDVSAQLLAMGPALKTDIR